MNAVVAAGRLSVWDKSARCCQREMGGPEGKERSGTILTRHQPDCTYTWASTTTPTLEHAGFSA